MHEHTQICRGLRLADSKHCIYLETFLITQTQYITLKSAFFVVVFLVEDSSHTGSLLYFRCCCLAPTFSTKRVCRHLRGFQGGNAAQCAERSNMRRVWSTMQHNSLDTSVPPGKLITSIRFVRVTPVLSLQLYKASVCLEFKHTGEATPQEKGSLYWENTAAHKTNTSGANSLKKRLV